MLQATFRAVLALLLAATSAAFVYLLHRHHGDGPAVGLLLAEGALATAVLAVVAAGPGPVARRVAVMVAFGMIADCSRRDDAFRGSRPDCGCPDDAPPEDVLALSDRDKIRLFGYSAAAASLGAGWMAWRARREARQ